MPLSIDFSTPRNFISYHSYKGPPEDHKYRSATTLNNLSEKRKAFPALPECFCADESLYHGIHLHRLYESMKRLSRMLRFRDHAPAHQKMAASGSRGQCFEVDPPWRAF